MARNAAYRWQNERKRGLLGKPKPTKSRKARISNRQASYLAALQRQLGERYTGDGMTRAEASRAIDAAKRLLKDASPKPGPTRTPRERSATRQ